MKYRLYKRAVLLFSVIASITLSISCSNDTVLSYLSESEKGVEAYLEVTICDREEFKTRANISSEDGWTYTSFTTGDIAGMFSDRGNLSNEDDEDYPGWVMNGQMYYMGSSGSSYRFGNSEIRLDPAQVGSGIKYLYYPYSDKFDQPFQSDGEGMKIRVDDNGIERCRDFMFSSSFTLTNGVLSPQFKHLFAEMIIIPGEGFNKAIDQEIKVVVANPYSDLKIVPSYYTSGTLYNWTTSLSYTGEQTEEARLQARTWEAWPGAQNKGRDAWYVVLPTNVSNSGSPSFSSYRVSYIELKDNYGHVQKVSDFTLHTYNGEDVKTIYSGYKYPLEIILTELGAIVRPAYIEDWNEPIEITDKRETGINDYADFEQWASTYNLYIQEGRPETEEVIEKLRKYGNGVRDTSGNWKWTFYITGDIELNESTSYHITKLEDSLEGASNYENFTIYNVRKTLIYEMESTGSLRKLNFKDLYVESTEGNSTGGLIQKMNGGIIEDCNVTLGIVVSDGPVGMISGSASNAVVNYCTVSGTVFGTQTSQEPYGFFGEEPYNCSFSENNSEELIFEPYN